MTSSPPKIGLHPFSGARAPVEYWGERATDGAVLISLDAGDLREAAPLLGQVVDGRYAVYDARILPNSIVYFAAHLLLEDDRHVVIKRVRPDHPQLELASRRLRHEARFLARLPKHRHLPQLYDLIHLDGAYHLVMERAPGQGLDAVLRTAGTLPVDVAATIMEQLLDGLAVCHAAGVVHRDLKPSNIMVARTADGPQLTLIDFGIAKDVAQTVTDLGTRLQPGTPAYMSPEQAWNGTVTPRSDLYSATAVLHRMLLGSAPVRDEATSALVLPAETQPAWGPLLETGLALFADGRFRDAPHFKAMLRASLPADRAVARPLPAVGLGTEQSRTGEAVPEALPPKPRRGRIWMLAGLAAIGTCLWLFWPVVLPELSSHAARVVASSVERGPDAQVPDAAPDARTVDARVIDAGVTDAQPDQRPVDAAPASVAAVAAAAPETSKLARAVRPKPARRPIKRRIKPKRANRKTIAPAAVRLADRIRSRHIARCECGPDYGAALKTLRQMQGGPALIEARKLKTCVHLFSPELQTCVQGRPVMKETP